jgi:peptidoglycan/xylan/chitin deacetylase (PgdA/CDA1 family)
MNHSEKSPNHKSASDLENKSSFIVFNIGLRIVLLSMLVLSSALGAGNSKKHQVIISFDDGYYSVYKYAFPVLKRHQVPITLGLITSYLEKSNTPRPYGNINMFMNRGEVQEMIDSLDIEIASHSVNHPDLTKLSEDKIKYELGKSKQTLDSLFNQETISFVYPYGAVNRKVVELTKAAGYKLGRSIRWGELNLWVDRYRLPIKEVRNSTTIDEIVRHIKNFKATVLLFHRLTPQPSVFTEYSSDKFSELINRLSVDKNIEFLTLQDLYLKWWQEIMTKYLSEKGWLANQILFDKIDVDQTRTFNSSIIK